MQLGGPAYRVRLTTDLTRYDKRLTVGQEGITMPGIKLSMWGSQDNFVAIRFDCGAEMDILFKSLVKI